MMPALARFLFSFFFLFSGSLLAHDFLTAEAVMTAHPYGRYEIDLTFELSSFVDEGGWAVSLDQLSAELRKKSKKEVGQYLQDIEQRFLREITLFVDEQTYHPEEVVLPSLDYVWNLIKKKGEIDPPQYKLISSTPFDWRNPKSIEITATIRGSYPTRSHNFRVAFPQAIGVISLSVLRPRSQVVMPGKESRTFLLRASPTSSSQTGDALESPAGLGEVLWRYLRLGFEHIVPKGLDHILFVLGLFFLSRRFKPLFWQVTAFTIAHSITLSLAMFKIVTLPASIVEPLIAFSIAFVAIENVVTNRLNPWRPFIVFLFGLLHGLGFAGVLSELGVPENHYIAALFFFNLGVECGQLSVIFLAFLIVGYFRKKPSYRKWVSIPASCLIATVGIYWTIERIFF